MALDDSVSTVRARIERGLLHPSDFRSALFSVAPSDRDEWVNRVFGIGEVPDDGPELPRGCVPYLPCSVDALLRVVDHAEVRASDVFVDIGSGAGRAAAFVHLLTGAGSIGIEIQPRLADASRDLAARLQLSRVACVEGDAVAVTRYIPIGSVFFLYCPFSGERLSKVLTDLEDIAQTRTIRVCCVDLPLPPRSWLTLDTTLGGDLAIYRSTIAVSPATPSVRRPAPA